MVFTPICPFLNTIPPMVFPHKTRFRIDLLPGTTETYITVDGQEGLLLQVGDRVEVTGLEDAVCFVGKEMPFFERLRTRGSAWLMSGWEKMPASTHGCTICSSTTTLSMTSIRTSLPVLNS